MSRHSLFANLVEFSEICEDKLRQALYGPFIWVRKIFLSFFLSAFKDLQVFDRVPLKSLGRLNCT